MILGVKDILAIVPELVVAGSACVLLLLDFALPRERKPVVAWLAIASVLVACVVSFYLVGSYVADSTVFAGLFTVDPFAIFFKVVLYVATVLSIMLSVHYVREEDIDMGEYYVLMLFSLSGMMVMASGADLLTIYVGLELMSLPIYVLVGFKQADVRSNEGAMKYVILGAFSSGILLYGMSLLYGLTGTTELGGIGAALADGTTHVSALSVAIVMLAAGFCFKVAGVPFHMWAPDAYEGAPTPITGFMSAAPKAAAFAVILRVFFEALAPVYDQWQVILAVVSIASMGYGNLVAIAQKNIKRMLAYSSIGHAGYALLGVLTGTAEGMASVMYYMAVYAFMNLGAFAVIVMMRKGNQKGEMIGEYAGLARSNKGLAFLMLLFMFSLTGLPPTAGFVGKFYIFMALIHEGMLGLAIFAALMSAVASFFYLRIVVVMYMKEPEGEFELAHSRGIYYTLGITAAATMLLGVWPGYILELAQRASEIL